MTETTYSKPLPRPRPVDVPYWEGARARELRLQRCEDCSTWRFPPSELCPNCLGEKSAWEAVSGRGRLWSWIQMHKAYFPGFRESTPYNVAFVQLDEGPYMMTSIVGTPSSELSCGLPVQVVFDAVTDEWVLPRFEVA
jgi:uncharacterized OB-fold protein